MVVGGSQGNCEATARKCAMVILEVAQVLGIKLKGASGSNWFGNAGSYVARLLYE